MKVAKFTLVLISVALQASPATAGWLKLAENDRLSAYYEPQKPDPSEATTIWVMYDYKTEQSSPSSGRRYRSQKGQQQMDCQGQRSRTVFFTWHAAQMGDGAVVYTGRTALPWESNSPGSIARALASISCTSK